MAEFGIKLVRLEIVGWKENNDKITPNIISKINLFVPQLDYKNIENIFESLNIKPIKILSNMKEKIDFNNTK